MLLILIRNIRLFWGILLVPIWCMGQDTTRFKLTTIQASASSFHVSSLNPQVGFAPSALISIKSFYTDSNHWQPKKIFHFVVMLGGAQSRFVMRDPIFLKGLYDKSDFYVFSQRLIGGFGLNVRMSAKKISFDMDLAPCLEIIKDRSDDARPDSVNGFRFYTDLYRGIQLFANAKVEYKFSDRFGTFISFATSVELVKKIGKDYPLTKNPFRNQTFTGIGLIYYYARKQKK